MGPFLGSLENPNSIVQAAQLGPVKLYRIQMGQWRKHPSRVDVTMMSAKGRATAFAPTKEMVYGTKYNGWSDQKYTDMYHAILAAIPETEWLWLRDEGSETGELAICCYCRVAQDIFCHTRLLVEYALMHHPELFCEHIPSAAPSDKSDRKFEK